MSFLNQLKSQAQALQSQQATLQNDLATQLQQTEAACQKVLHYFNELARQLNVLGPAAPPLSLDGKTPWPPMKLLQFRVDVRKKLLRQQEVVDYIGMAWQILPQQGAVVPGVVSVNFPPDLKRVEERLHVGMVRHERREQRHPEKGSLLAIRFEYQTESRGNVVVTPDHDRGRLSFRLVNLSGFGVQQVDKPVAEVGTPLMDELAKLLVSQPNRFLI